MIEALASTTIAGLATLIGGALVIFARGNVKPTLFAASLAFASGVMLLISFVEVYVEGSAYIKLAMNGADEHEGHESHAAEGHMHDGGAPFSVSMILFLCGWLLSCVMHGLLHWFTDDHHSSSPAVGVVETVECNKCTLEEAPKMVSQAEIEVVEEEESKKKWASRLIDSGYMTWLTGGRPQTMDEKITLRKMFVSDHSAFTHLGYFTALALTLHNIPEGMATFAAAANNTKFGVGLAFAIGIHNIPEGLAVALPIYIGTGSIKKALLFTCISALAEPLGGLITYAILREPSPWIYGILFIMTAGIMFAITLKELLPTANRYDPTNRVTSLCLFLGMVVMAGGLSIINIS